MTRAPRTGPPAHSVPLVGPRTGAARVRCAQGALGRKVIVGGRHGADPLYWPLALQTQDVPFANRIAGSKDDAIVRKTMTGPH